MWFPRAGSLMSKRYSRPRYVNLPPAMRLGGNNTGVPYSAGLCQKASADSGTRNSSVPVGSWTREIRLDPHAGTTTNVSTPLLARTASSPRNVISSTDAFMLSRRLAYMHEYRPGLVLTGRLARRPAVSAVLPDYSRNPSCRRLRLSVLRPPGRLLPPLATPCARAPP